MIQNQSANKKLLKQQIKQMCNYFEQAQKTTWSQTNDSLPATKDIESQLSNKKFSNCMNLYQRKNSRKK